MEENELYIELLLLEMERRFNDPSIQAQYILGVVDGESLASILDIAHGEYFARAQKLERLISTRLLSLGLGART